MLNCTRYELLNRFAGTRYKIHREWRQQNGSRTYFFRVKKYDSRAKGLKCGAQQRW